MSQIRPGGTIATANYHFSQMEDKYILSSLSHVGTIGRYQVYQLDSGTPVVIFTDQTKMSRVVNDNPNSLYLVRLAKESSIIGSYDVEFGEVDIKDCNARTVCQLIIAADMEGEGDISVTTDSQGNIIVE